METSAQSLAGYQVKTENTWESNFNENSDTYITPGWGWPQIRDELSSSASTGQKEERKIILAQAE